MTINEFKPHLFVGLSPLKSNPEPNTCPYCGKNMISWAAIEEIRKLFKENRGVSYFFNPGGCEFNFTNGKIQIQSQCDNCDLIDFKGQLAKLNKNEH